MRLPPIEVGYFRWHGEFTKSRKDFAPSERGEVELRAHWIRCRELGIPDELMGRNMLNFMTQFGRVPDETTEEH